MVNDGARSGAARATSAESSFLYGSNAPYIEALYEQFLRDPRSVDAEWQSLFAQLNDQRAAQGMNGKAAWAPSWGRPELLKVPEEPPPPGAKGAKPAAAKEAKPASATPAAADPAIIRKAAQDTLRASMLIHAYRVRGHLEANLDPLNLEKKEPHAELTPEFFGFTAADYDRPIFLDGKLGFETATLRQIVDLLRRTYCGRIGFEFMHITDPEQKDWIQRRIEGEDKTIAFTPEGKKAILNKLAESEGFENFCAKKFVGTKRFGLDGGEALIPALEQIIKVGGNLGAKDIVLGMAHRGRLNVLANVMAKPYRAIFHEFKGGTSNPEDVGGSGDVKYHMGASSDRDFAGTKVHLSLTANPSHLEAVNPVVLGKARAKQHQHGDRVARTSVIPLLLHGDAAFAGQGVVAECFAMSGTKGFRTGGTIHVVINNQIGFTTAPMHSRSSPYPSDIALMVQAPILHVNGDDPEAVVHCARIATEFRQKFHKDVVLDIFCYRRFGHNEGDDPSMTQPLMYKAIKDHPTTFMLYARQLVEEGLMTADEAEGYRTRFAAHLEDEFKTAESYKPNKADWLDGAWAGMSASDGDDRRGDTAVSMDLLTEVGQALTRIPASVNVHKTVQRFLDARKNAVEAKAGIDWATGEALAFGTLLTEQVPIRLCGQDSTRGTFVQRHSAMIDTETEERWYPLNHIREGAQAEYEVIDSFLSEEAALGFEYGFSLAEPKALTLWEAQFGDFVNGAQIIIDQFITSGEKKWLRLSGLVMLLPHGYEGQGPEHSSARLERFLQLCAEDNIQVCNLSTPANYFHALRRQIHRNFRKPLILMTPKSLLRHKRCVSKLEDMGPGTTFHRVLRDDAENPASAHKILSDDKIKRVVLCAGKVYYDLLEEREKRGINNVYLLRIEQFYPFPARSLMAELQRFKGADMVWAQEEPKNMGAWSFIEPNLEWALSRAGAKMTRPRYAGRPAAASPAVGTMSAHLAQLKNLLDEALTL
jgi:2-oxoglutarate dehydrogenase E1 component